MNRNTLDLIGHLEKYKTISLEEMASVRLMNRTDSKYICSKKLLGNLLELAQNDYLVQETSGMRSIPYRTEYLDSPGYDMYLEHHRGRKNRFKIRIRTYVQSSKSFLEVKHKDNKGKTRKTRIACGNGNEGFSSIQEDGNCRKFVEDHSIYRLEELAPAQENSFDRITLVNIEKTERLTIDINLETRNPRTGYTASFPELAIIELKMDGRKTSKMKDYLKELRIKPAKFSKYCIGTALTTPGLKQNRFKPRIHRTMKCTEIKIVQ